MRDIIDFHFTDCDNITYDSMKLSLNGKLYRYFEELEYDQYTDGAICEELDQDERDKNRVLDKL